MRSMYMHPYRKVARTGDDGPWGGGLNWDDESWGDLFAADAPSANAPAAPPPPALVKELKEALEYKRPNVCLLATNLFYIAVSLAVVSIGTIVIREHVDDLEDNIFYAYEDGKTAPTPCALPTPDSMRLLQALGTLPHAGITAALLAPEYGTWVGSIRDNMCFRRVVGRDDPVFSSGGGGSCEAGSTTYSDTTPHAEALLALSGILGTSAFEPDEDDFAAGAAGLTAKLAEFDKKTCLTSTHEDGTRPYYDQKDRYGDIKVRAMRTYLTAMPSFHHYQQQRDTCWTKGTDPFNTDCKHACHIAEELTAAAADVRFMVKNFDTEEPAVDLPSVVFSDVLYRLLALAVVGHYDRVSNEGKCFKNNDPSTSLPYATALAFCQAVLDAGTPTLHTDASGATSYADPLSHYAQQQTDVAENFGCEEEDATVEARHFTDRASAADVAAVYDTVCANTLEFGLFEQGRLFGIQDPTGPFVVDARGKLDVLGLGHLFAQILYLNVQDEDSHFTEPKARLELYMAYRLAGTAIWGTLAAAITGYFFWRAVFPAVVFTTRYFGFRQSDGAVIKLMRPEAEQPLWIAFGFTLLLGYWMVEVDPATQSHYPITTDCSKFLGKDDLVSPSVYVNTWGKRRFDRNGEQELGLLLWVFAGIVAFQQYVGRRCVPKDVRNANISPLAERAPSVAFWIIYLTNVVNIIVFAAATAHAGGKWLEKAAVGKDTTALVDILVRDCFATFYAGFWAGSTVAVVRQRWAVFKLPWGFKFLWAAIAILLAWMPVLQCSVLFEAEWQGYFAGDSDYRSRAGQAGYAIANGVVSTVLIAALLIDENKMGNIRAKGDKGTASYRERVSNYLSGLVSGGRSRAPAAAASARKLIQQYGKEAFLGGGKISSAVDAASVERFSFKFSDDQLGLANAPGYTTAAFAPRSLGLGLGRRDKDRMAYLPMLQFPA